MLPPTTFYNNCAISTSPQPLNLLILYLFMFFNEYSKTATTHINTENNNDNKAELHTLSIKLVKIYLLPFNLYHRNNGGTMYQYEEIHHRRYRPIGPEPAPTPPVHAWWNCIHLSDGRVVSTARHVATNRRIRDFLNRFSHF